MRHTRSGHLPLPFLSAPSMATMVRSSTVSARLIPMLNPSEHDSTEIGVQVMKEWENYFDNPSDQTRGFMVAGQTFGSVIVSTTFTCIVVNVSHSGC
jgi:hypothetical protein